MKTIAVWALGLLGAVSAQAQTDADPVVMHINGQSVTRSAFEYSFNKNNADGVLDKKDVDDYAQLFINFKLKVEAAREAGIDTLTNIRKELQGYREQLVLPTLTDSDYVEREARKTYDATAQRFQGEDLITASHILVLLRQDATAEQQAAAKTRIDSIYAALQGGADFAELARKCSDDKGSAGRGGELGQFGKGMMIPDFETAAYALKAGEMSAPVQTAVGWHIIKVKDRHPFEPYEFHHDNIVRFLEQRGIREAAANALIDTLGRQSGKDRSAIIDSLYDDLLSHDSEARNLAQEYYDGTLMYEICKTQIWDAAAKDEDALEAYFREHREQYAWEEPRWRGIVVRAKTKDVLSRAKKLTKGVDEAAWPKTIVDALNTDSLQVVRVEHGLYKKGDSKTVDHAVFKVKNDTKPSAQYPYVTTIGKKLKQPETFKDVRGQVTTDFQNAKEEQWVETLRKHFTFDIDEAVLSTVNKH